MAETKKPPSRESKLRAAAKAAGLTLEKQGKGWQLVDAVSGTLVAADWTDDGAGLTLDQIEESLKQG